VNDENELKRRQDAAVDKAVGRQITPMEGGASARAAAHHGTAKALRRRPDAHLYEQEIIGHEMAARALSDAELAERDDD
jgi:hypothetical protein